MKFRFYQLKRMQSLNRFFAEALRQFSCELPETPSSAGRTVFKKIFGRIKLSTLHTSSIKDFPPDACVVYVNKFKSKFEFLFANTSFSSHGLPVPMVAVGHQFWFFQPFKRFMQLLLGYLIRIFSIHAAPSIFEDQYLESRLLEGKALFISLVETREFYLRFIQKKPDPIQYLIERQIRMDRPVFIVPQLFFYAKTPDTSKLKLKDIVFGLDQRPGTLRKLIKSILWPERMFVELSMPIDLRAFIAGHRETSDPAQLTMMLRRELLNQITRHRQNTTGPVLKSPDEIKQNVLMDEDLQSHMRRHAQRRNHSLAGVRKEAVVYFDEIAAKYSPGMMSIAVRIIQWMSNSLFEGVSVDIKRLKNIKTMALNGSIIYVPCHRSHIDSLVMLATTYTNHMSPPHIFAGKNLSFWPMGPLLRRIGVFFVRRSFQGAVFYTKVFTAYISRLIEEGYHLNVFIEGTRSRSGKLLQPQLGMLTILLDVFQKNVSRDMIFVPVYIGYDRVPEEKEYLNEIQGGTKKPENARQLMKFGKLFQKRFGKIYVKFTDPISLKALLAQMELPEGALTSKEKNSIARHLGDRIMHHIDQATIVTPQALVGSALLNSDRPIRPVDDLFRQIDFYLSYLNFKKAELSESLLINPKNAVHHILTEYAQAKVIDTLQTSPDEWKDTDTFKINKNKRSVIDYYKNNCIIHFIPAAFTAVSILARDTFQFQTSELIEEYEVLSDLFRFEFTHDPEKPADYYLRKSIKAFIDDAVLSPHPTLPDTYSITSAGYRKFNDLAAFLFPFIEAYWIVLKWLSQEPKKNIDLKARRKKIINFGQHLHKNRTIHQVESLSVSNIESALFYFNRNGVRGAEDLSALQHYEERMAPLMQLMNR